MPTDDEHFMQMAIELATRGKSTPDGKDPFVGAVVVKNGQLLASAYRGETKEGRHAEYVVLEKKLRRKDLIGATIYTTLEPCTTRGPEKIPCADRIASRGIER